LGIASSFFVGCTKNNNYIRDEKPRVIIMSDIGGSEPDDLQSFIRLLLYSNELDIEGLIGVNSQFGVNRGDTKVFDSIIQEYSKILPNLKIHASGYPSAEELQSVVYEGQRTYPDMEGVGKGFSTPGSNHILQVLKNSDTRPLWILAWGGTNTLAQTLYDLSNEGLPPEVLKRHISKIHVYDIAGQDLSGAWIAHAFPSIFYIRSKNQFRAFSHRESWQGHSCQDGDLSIANPEWFKQNIRENHGSLGKMYPSAKYMWEGDTPSFLYLIPNGLSDPKHPSYGSWGGRFSIEKIENAGRYYGKDSSKYMPAPMFADAEDKIVYEDSVYKNPFTPLWRWRTAYQNDFAARMDWTIHPEYNQANHPPVAIIDEDQTKHLIYKNVNPGDSILLSAKTSNDPDGDSLNFRWWLYKEAGHSNTTIKMNNETSSKVTVHIPNEAQSGDSFHIILSLSDNGTPILTTYRRVVVNLK
jgi:hypothetical protein